MKPPDPSMLGVVWGAIGLVLVSVAASPPNVTSDQAHELPPPQLLKVPRSTSNFSRSDAALPRQGISAVSVEVPAAVEGSVKFSSKEVDNLTAQAGSGSESQDDLEKVEELEEVVTKMSVRGTVKELITEDGVVPNDGEQQPVTRTSLTVSEVQLEPSDEVNAVSETNLQQAVTQMSIRFSQQEVVQEISQTDKDANQNARQEVEKIQEILKQIQNEVGEGRILYVADPKAKKGVRIGHQTTEAPVQEAPYDHEDDDDIDYEDPGLSSTTSLSIVQLKKLSLPRNRPTIGRQKPGSQTADVHDQSEHNVIGLKQRPQFSRPAFGILQRPQKPTIVSGPRTVRPFVKVFDRAKTRPLTKTVQQIRPRKPGTRITTAKPVRKGFPIGPPKSAIPSDAPVPSGPSLADFEELYRRQKAQRGATETSTYRTIDEDVPDDFGEPYSDVPLVYYEGQTKISDGWEWSPYLDDRNTKEFKYLAFHVRHQLKSFLDETRYGEFLNYILLDGFTRQLTVDLFLVFYKTEPMINETELTDELREIMAYKTEAENDFEFVLDSNSTFFRFKFVKSPATERLIEAPLLPNWAIAMLVFGFGSLILIAGSVIMANNFRSIRKLKTTKRKRQQEKQLQMQMTNMPHRYPEARNVKDRHSGKNSNISDESSRAYAGSAGTLDKRPPMLERYQKDYGTYEQNNPPHEELYGEYGSKYGASQDTFKNREIRIRQMSADRYSTVGSHFPSSYKSLLQPSKSILYRPPR